MNGLAGPIAMGAPPALSSEWFPPEQRTTATAIATVSNTLGLAVSFLLGTLLYLVFSILVIVVVIRNANYGLSL